MALRPAQRICFVLAAVLAAAAAVHAEDSRIDKAKKARDEILQKRRTQPAGAAVRPDLPAADSDPVSASILAARERLAALDRQIEEKRRQSEAVAAPRDKLQARSDELALHLNAIQEQNRARVEAIYRSAKLGAGAAGWHPEPARSARLSRYLASVADVQQKKLELVEIEHGSIIASLDKARADDASVRGELRALDVDRTEALARLERAMTDAGVPRMADAGAPRMAGLTPEEAEAEALAQEHAVARSGSPEASSESALAVERAMALLQAKAGTRPAGETSGGRPAGEPAAMPPGGESARAAAGGAAIGESGAPSSGAVTGELATEGDFTWTSPGAGKTASDAGAASKAAAEAPALAEAKAALEARAAAAAKAAEEKAAAKAAEDRAAAKAAEERAAAEAEIAKAKAAEAKMADEARAAREKAAAEAAKPAKVEEDAHGTSGELEDGPAVLAPSSPPAGAQVASVPAQPGDDPAPDAGASTDPDKRKRPGLFSRMFGGDRESDAFAASRGSLPPPVAGKVVANYGQQHKSGATYRGVILRAGHSAPIKAVAGGKVSFAGNVPGLGNTVIVSHGGRYHTVYARLGSLEVKLGESVGRGTEIGTLPADNADMHFELRDQGKAIDPVPWLKGGVPGAAQ